MMINRLMPGLLAGLALASLASGLQTSASAHPYHPGVHIGAHYYGTYWRDGFWLPRYWARGIVLNNGCPVGYVRDGGLCFPTF
jgi:hypothetical protein